jgi:hypothetical protein
MKKLLDTILASKPAKNAMGWKTTLAGALCLAVGAYALYLGQSEVGLAALTGGLGLVFAVGEKNPKANGE